MRSTRLRAVVHGLNGNTFRQALLYLLDSGRCGTCHCPTVLADEHEDCAEHHFLPILRRRSAAELAAFANGRDVANANRYAIAPVENDLFECLEILRLAGHTHEELLAVALDVTGTNVLIVPLDGFDQVIQREAVRQQPCRVRHDMNLPLIAANGIHLSDALRIAQLRPHDPIVQCAQVG